MPKLQGSFIEIALRHGCSRVNLLHILRIPFSRTPLNGCFCTSLSFTISSVNILLSTLVSKRFFDQDLTHTLFLFFFCFVVF